MAVKDEIERFKRLRGALVGQCQIGESRIKKRRWVVTSPTDVRTKEQDCVEDEHQGAFS